MEWRPHRDSRKGQVDVCIVGAGIAGLTMAYLLAKEGKRIIVVDDDPTAGGKTCQTTAHLVSALDDRYLMQAPLPSVLSERRDYAVITAGSTEGQPKPYTTFYRRFAARTGGRAPRSFRLRGCRTHLRSR